MHLVFVTIFNNKEHISEMLLYIVGSLKQGILVFIKEVRIGRGDIRRLWRAS
jgi:hypothetical protein